MLSVLFLFLIGTIIFMYFYFNQQLANLRKQVLALNTQKNKLKCSKKKLSVDYLTIKFIEVNKTTACLKNDCNLMLSPIETSVSLLHLNKNIYVEVIYSCIIDDEEWIEVIIKTEDNINNKGWIKKTCLNIEEA